MSVPANQRFNMLGPYLESLRSTEPGRFQGPMLATLDGEEIVVDEWALGQLEQFLRASEDSGETEQLVADSIALLTKYASDLKRSGLAADSRSFSNPATEAELMLDAAIGMALVKQIQAVIDRLLQEGSIQEARPLSRFHHTLRHAAFDARNRINTAQHGRLDDLTTDLAAAVGHEEAAEPAQEDHPDASRKKRVRTQTQIRPARARILIQPSKKPSKLPNLTEILILLVVIAFAVRFGGEKLQPEPVVLHPAPTAKAISAIDSKWNFEFRYPAVFATVESANWDDLDPVERHALLLRVSQLVGTHGYSGLFLTSTDGTPLAQWNVREGAEPQFKWTLF